MVSDPTYPRERSPARRALRRLVRRRGAMVGLGFVAFFVVLALFAPAIAPFDPLATSWSAIRKAPSAAHWFGTDEIGRDVLSRVIWGTRVSLMAGFGSVALAMVTGGLLGLLAGYAGGRTDGLVMRLMDAVLSFPPLVLALALGAVLGAGLTGVVIALGVVYTPTFARLMRGQVLTITARDYVEAARALGAPGWRIAWHHVLPNATAPIVIQASLSVAFAILAEASLSFLGLGIQPPTPSWGSIMSVGRNYVATAWWIATFPGICLFLLVLSVNLCGDHLRDRIDPRSGLR